MSQHVWFGEYKGMRVRVLHGKDHALGYFIDVYKVSPIEVGDPVYFKLHEDDFPWLDGEVDLMPEPPTRDVYVVSAWNEETEEEAYIPVPQDIVVMNGDNPTVLSKCGLFDGLFGQAYVDQLIELGVSPKQIFGIDTR